MICLLRTSIHYQAFPSCKRHPKWGLFFFFFPISSIVHTANSSEGFFVVLGVFFNGLYNSCGNFSKCRHLASFSHSPQISITAAHTAGSPHFSFSIPVAAPDLFIFVHPYSLQGRHLGCLAFILHSAKCGTNVQWQPVAHQFNSAYNRNATESSFWKFSILYLKLFSFTVMWWFILQLDLQRCVALCKTVLLSF